MISVLLFNASKKIDPLDAQILLAHVLDKPREFLITHEDERISVFKQLKFKRLITKRKSGIPLAYLTGHKEFFGLDFLVNKHTLIPRPDTEILVEATISCIIKHVTYNNPVTLIDVGTGSGCIPISIIKTLEHKNIKADVQTYAIDISKPALKAAQQNTKIHNTKIIFLRGNLLEPFAKQYENETIKQYNNLIITANLPYLTEEQFQTEASIQHEPKSALVAQKNGLALYEELLKQIKLICDTWYVMHSITCFFEIDPDQTGEIKKLISTHLPNAEVNIIQDLTGFDRVVEIQI